MERSLQSDWSSLIGSERIGGVAGRVGERRAIGYDDAVIHEVGGDFDAQVETAKRMRQIVAM